MHVELVVCDMAGTTVHDEDTVHHCLCAALEAIGVPTSRDAANEVMGLPKPDAIRLLLRAVPGTEPLQQKVPAIHADFVARMIDFYRTSPTVKEVEGAAATFARLRAAGIKVALDTGFSSDITQTILDRLGWRIGDTLDGVVSSDQVAQGRPAPDMIHHLMQALQVTDPQRVAKVGDTPSDLHEGTNAKCGYVIGVTQGSHTEAQLLPHPHTHLIPSVAALPQLLEKVKGEA